MATTYTLPHAPTFQLTVLDECDKPERDWHFRQVADRREKSHKAAQRLSKERPRKTARTRAFPSPNSFPKLAGFRDEMAYEQLMGRPWADPEPAPSDFGGPEYPPMPVASRPNWRYTCAEKKRADEEERRARDEWQALYDAYRIAMDAWTLTDDHARWETARQRYYARIEQFSYNPRARNAKDVLAKAVTVRG